MSRHYPNARIGQDRANHYDEITNKIIAELEAGRVPWVQPWGTAAAKAPLAIPKSAASGRQYSGINILILWGAATERGFTGQSWLTFRQALPLGGQVSTATCRAALVLGSMPSRSSSPRYRLRSVAPRSVSCPRCGTPTISARGLKCCARTIVRLCELLRRPARLRTISLASWRK